MKLTRTERKIIADLQAGGWFSSAGYKQQWMMMPQKKVCGSKALYLIRRSTIRAMESKGILSVQNRGSMSQLLPTPAALAREQR